jgi:phenol 2-monooxygenase
MPISLVRETDVDVLVIGAGPAGATSSSSMVECGIDSSLGLMCANALAKAGVNVRIIDERSVQFNYVRSDILSKAPIRPSRVAAGQADGIQASPVPYLIQ